MKIFLKKANGDVVTPKYKTLSAFCCDLTAISVEEIHPDVFCYDTGISVEIACGEDEPIIEGLPIKKKDVLIGFDIRPRSSIRDTGLIICNAPGTIDDDYRGRIKVTFRWIDKNLPIYKVGDRIAQMNLALSLPMTFIEKEELSETERGEGGFGSTGK